VRLLEGQPFCFFRNCGLIFCPECTNVWRGLTTLSLGISYNVWRSSPPRPADPFNVWRGKGGIGAERPPYIPPNRREGRLSLTQSTLCQGTRPNINSIDLSNFSDEKFYVPLLNSFYLNVNKFLLW